MIFTEVALNRRREGHGTHGENAMHTSCTGSDWRRVPRSISRDDIEDTFRQQRPEDAGLQHLLQIVGNSPAERHCQPLYGDQLQWAPAFAAVDSPIGGTVEEAALSQPGHLPQDA
jgi:hypothetical protein